MTISPGLLGSRPVMSTNRAGLKFALLAAFMIVALFAVEALDIKGRLSAGALRSWVDSLGALGPVAFIAMYALSAVFMLPALPITIAAGILFGAVKGMIYVEAGATLGAAAAFLIARKMGREWIERMVSRGGRLAFLDKKSAETGWRLVAFTRIVPVFPYSLLNYAFGLTSIGFGAYIAATAVFMLPGIMAYVLFSSSLPSLLAGEIRWEFVAGALLILLLLISPLVYRKLRTR